MSIYTGSGVALVTPYEDTEEKRLILMYSKN